ncbi:MAG: hypothetical protein IJ697_08650 [Synergistaceae bacterium]|nr:hypothetical protein [Synergistaceae bacterium]
MYTDVADIADVKTSESFRTMLDDAKEWAERSGLREEDIDDVIKSVRRKKRI